MKKNVNENIQCVHGYAFSSDKQKIRTWVNEEIWGMIKTGFPYTTQMKNFQKLFHAKNIHILKKI